MLIAKATGIFTSSFDIFDDDRHAARIKTSAWSVRAEAEVKDNDLWKFYTLKRDGWLTGSFLLLEAERVVCSAVKPSAFYSRFELALQGQQYELLRPSFWSIRFELVKDGVAVGSIMPRGFFRRRIEIDLPDELPLFFKVFIFWLALVIWKREQQTSAAS